jgi:hypothetical protein
VLQVQPERLKESWKEETEKKNSETATATRKTARTRRRLQAPLRKADLDISITQKLASQAYSCLLCRAG